MDENLTRRLPAWLIRWLDNEIVRRVLRNATLLFSATGIAAFLSMLQGILSARLLGVAVFGVLGVITLFTSVLNRLASSRMHELVIRYVGEYNEQGDHGKAAAVFKAAALTETGSSLVAFALIVLLAPWGALIFVEDASLAPLFTLYGLTVLANLITESATGLLQLFDRYRWIAAVNVFQAAVTLTLITIVFLFQGDLAGIVLAYLGGKITMSLGLAYGALREAGIHWGAGWWRSPVIALRPRARELARFAISTNLSATLSLINKDSELLWVSYFRNDLETGYYKLAIALANIVSLPISPLPQATYPDINRETARGNWTNLRYVLRQGSVLAGGYTLAATIGLAILGQWLIGWVYGGEYAPAFPALMIMLAGILVANTFYWARPALLALGFAGYATRVNLLVTIVKLIGLVILLPRIGYLASPMLLSLTYWLGIGLSVGRVRQEIRRRETLPSTAMEAAG